jgi:exopolyphosphatase / guanosine-5'-triphosphate,3'-diphosphate pyrophosphatase
MHIAVIDIGSDSIQLLAVETSAIGDQRILRREQNAVPLGKGTAKNGTIQPDPFQAGLEALAWMAEVARGCSCDALHVAGTAILRNAANASRFAEEAGALGLKVRILSAEEEIRLIFHAASQAMPFQPEPCVLVDTSGGTTKLIWMHGGQPLASLTLPWDPQRLADTLPTSDPPTPEDLKRVTKSIRRILKQAGKQLPEGLPRPSRLVGTSAGLSEWAKGTGEPHGFSHEQLLRFKQKMWHSDRSKRMSTLAVPGGQADIAHLGASWALGFMEWLDAPFLECRPVSLCEGLLLETLRHGGVRSPSAPEYRQGAVEALAEELDTDRSHSLHVADLSDRLFRDLAPVFHLGDDERELLQCAARLHDIGISVSEKDHHKHGAALIQGDRLPGFWPREIEILAQVVRWHRGKSASLAKHEEFLRLAPWHRAVIEKLTAILRAADALDRSRRQAVRSVRVHLENEEAQILIQGSGDLSAELERFKEKGAFLFRLLDRSIRTVVTSAS